MGASKESAGNGAKGRKRQYGDAEKARALSAVRANNGNVKKTARQLGVPPRTLANWSKGVGQNADVRRMVEEKSLSLADELDAIAFQCVGLLPAKLPKASVKEIVGALSQSIEKGRLLRGKPTAIIADTARNTVQVIVKMTGLNEERARQIVAGQFGIPESELVSEEVM